MENKAVLFIDLLGFAKLTEQHPLEFETIRRRQNVLSTFESIVHDQNPLTETFTSFHYALKWAIELAQMRHPLTAITFSDSAFVATARLPECVDIAIHIMQALLRRRVPARAAIAWGTFATIRFKSDLIGDSGDHAAQFLGTGVVRASAAERCGIKGMRILVDPSVPLLTREMIKGSGLPETQYLPCPTEDLTNGSGVKHEINYWQLRRTEEAEAWRALQDMWSSAPGAEVKHYEDTARAIDRMRVHRGEPPLGNLRRRTLPRKTIAGAV